MLRKPSLDKYKVCVRKVTHISGELWSVSFTFSTFCEGDGCIDWVKGESSINGQCEKSFPGCLFSYRKDELLGVFISVPLQLHGVLVVNVTYFKSRHFLHTSSRNDRRDTAEFMTYPGWSVQRERKNEGELYFPRLSFKLSDLPYTSFTFAARTNLLSQAAIQQNLAKKFILGLSPDDKCIFGKGHVGCCFLKHQPCSEILNKVVSSCLPLNSVEGNTNKSEVWHFKAGDRFI